MNTRLLAIVAVGVLLMAKNVRSQTQPTARGSAENGSPAWFLQGSFPDPGGNTSVDAEGRVTVIPRNGVAARTLPPLPACSRSPVCGNRLTPGRQTLQRVQWQQK